MASSLPLWSGLQAWTTKLVWERLFKNSSRRKCHWLKINLFMWILKKINSLPVAKETTTKICTRTTSMSCGTWLSKARSSPPKKGLLRLLTITKSRARRRMLGLERRNWWGGSLKREPSISWSRELHNKTGLLGTKTPLHLLIIKMAMTAIWSLARKKCQK